MGAERATSLPLARRNEDEARRVLQPGVIWRIGRDPNEAGDIEVLARITAVDVRQIHGHSIAEDGDTCDEGTWGWDAAETWPWGTADESTWLIALLQGRWIPPEE